jgi:hypothetical protein
MCSGTRRADAFGYQVGDELAHDRVVIGARHDPVAGVPLSRLLVEDGMRPDE